MSLLEPTAAQLRQTGSLKWTGMQTSAKQPAAGAWVAEMDFGTAPQIAKRFHTAIDQGLLGYTPKWVTQGAAESLSRFQERRFGWVIDPGWVRTTSSILGTLRASIEHMTRPGSPIIVPTPAYMPFLTIPVSLGREVITVSSPHTPNLGGVQGIGARESWSLDLDGIRKGLERGAGMVILCNPWNPTGRFLRTSELRALHDLVVQYDAIVFSDEIHSPLVFGDASQFVSYASLGPTFAAHTVTAVAASKGWNIAGLPAAQVVLEDAALRERWDQDAAKHAHGATTLGLIGAITAYEEGEPWLDEVRAYLSENLDLVDQAVATTQIDYQRPQSTYLTWWGWDAYEMPQDPATILLEGAQVGTNAGSTLGLEYRQWSRINVAMPRLELERSLDSILLVVQELPLR